MNAYGKRTRGVLEVCPKCHRDSGERKESVNLPFRSFVQCASCGYIVAGDNQSVATRKWNAESRRAQR